MKVISNRDGDFLSQFAKVNENDIRILSRINDLPPQIRSTPHQKMLIDNHFDAKKGKIKRYIYLEDLFGFCKTFKRVTENLAFHLMLKTNDSQDTLYTSMADDINITINNLYLFVPKLIPSIETQLMFNEATQNNHRTCLDENYPERPVIKDMIVQHDIGSAKQVNAPKFLVCAHQAEDRIDTDNALFDHLNLRKYYVEIDSFRYPRDSLLINYDENDYIELYKNIKLFFKEYIGESILNLFLSYPDMETKYPIGIFGVRHQSDHSTPKTIQIFQEYGADADNARLFLILIRRRETQLISVGNNLIEVKVL